MWDDHIFITTAISAGQEPAPIPGLYDSGDGQGKNQKSSFVHRWMLYDVDFKTGDVRWERELQSELPQIVRHTKNSFASETPVTDGERVYLYVGSVGLLAAFDLDGTPVWTKQIGVFGDSTLYGTAASPTLHKDRLYIVNDNTTQSFVAAFDKRTGGEVWSATREEDGGNWATPFVWENELRTEVVTSGRGVRSYDLDGTLLWELQGMTHLNVPSPFAKHGLLYVGAGYPASALRPVYAIRPGATGDISLWPEGTFSGPARFPGPRTQSKDDSIAWSYPLLGTYNTSALVYGDYYYTLLDRGFLLCHDARTGEQVYGRQRISSGTAFTASPWAYNGKVFLLSEDGDTYVVRAGPDYEMLGKNSLNEMSLATPAVAQGSVILRTQSALYRIANGAQLAPPGQ